MRSQPPIPVQSLVVLLLLSTPFISPFSPHVSTTTTTTITNPTTTLLQKHDRSISTTFLSMTDPSPSSSSSSSTKASAALTEAKKLRDKALKLRLEADRDRAQLNLEKIAKLEAALEVSASSSSSTEEKKSEVREQVRNGIEQLVREVDPALMPTFELSAAAAAATNTLSTTEPTTEDPTEKDRKADEERISVMMAESDLSAMELSSATEYYQSLPITMRHSLAEAVGLNYYNVSPSLILVNLYEKMDTLDMKELRSIYTRRLKDPKQQDTSPSVITLTINSDGTIEDENGLPAEEELKRQVKDLIDEFQTEISNGDNTTSVVESILPRVTRPEDGRMPSLEDVEVLVSQVLNKDNWMRSGVPEAIPGGYLVRGTISQSIMKPKRETREKQVRIAANADYGGDVDGNEDDDESASRTASARLLDNIDASLDQIDPTWNEKYQVSHVYDVTLTDLEEGLDAPVLLVTTRNFRPENTRSVLRTSVTLLSFFLAAVFLVQTYADNTTVVQRLTEASQVANESGAFVDTSWFNELLKPSLVALGVPQLGSEVMHQFIARRDGFKTTAPTVLPAVTLPYLSFQTGIKTSPKNPSSLFDYGIAGPATGMILSMAIFAYGLRLTIDADPASMVYAPSLPVSFLQYSTLFGTIIDYVLSGGDGGVFDGQGVILTQAPNTPVPLHPYAIAGMASFLIHSLDVIPVGGNTDGSRMSQALLGRKEHLGFSAGVALVLFVYVLFGMRSELLGAYLITMWFVQKDGTEVLCRDEVEKAGLGRAAAALVVWSVAVLALTPIG